MSFAQVHHLSGHEMGMGQGRLGGFVQHKYESVVDIREILYRVKVYSFLTSKITLLGLEL